MNPDELRASCLLCKTLLLSVLLGNLIGCDPDSSKSEYDFNDRIHDSRIATANTHPHKRDDNVLYFGFDLRASPQEDARQYLPFLTYLQQQTGQIFKLRFISKKSSIVKELGSGHIHFAAIGAKSYILANQLYDARILARGINPLGKAEYRSMIVVAPDSKIKTLDELKNKKLAFGHMDSTQGHLIPRIILKEHNISLEQLAEYQYTGSHQQCVNKVISATFDACGMQDTMASELAQQGLVRILYTSRYYPSSGIAANKDVAQEIIEKVTKALLDFAPNSKHKKQLYHWHKTEMPNGFTPASNDDYDELKSWIIELKMLQKSTG